MPEEQPSIGLGIREARQKLAELIAARQKVAGEMIPFAPNQYGDTPLKFIELSQKLNAINDEIAQVREWYNIGLSESLYHESKRLNTLTLVLIGLTAVLGVLTIADILSRVIIHA
jgi:hypothetical protein